MLPVDSTKLCVMCDMYRWGCLCARLADLSALLMFFCHVLSSTLICLPLFQSYQLLTAFYLSDLQTRRGERKPLCHPTVILLFVSQFQSTLGSFRARWAAMVALLDGTCTSSGFCRSWQLRCAPLLRGALCWRPWRLIAAGFTEICHERER